MTAWFVVMDANHKDAALVANERFESEADAMAYVKRYNLDRRETGWQVFEGALVASNETEDVKS